MRVTRMYIGSRVNETFSHYVKLLECHAPSRIHYGNTTYSELPDGVGDRCTRADRTEERIPSLQ